MTDSQRSLYEKYVAAPAGPFSLVAADGRLQGPPAVWVLSPTFGHALQHIGRAVRYESRLPARAREIAILLVGHRQNSAFELWAHSRAGLASGLTPSDLAALAAGDSPHLMSDIEGLVLFVTRKILDHGTLTDDEYRDAVGQLGEAGLLELVTIVGYYTMVAWQLAVFDVQP